VRFSITALECKNSANISASNKSVSERIPPAPPYFGSSLDEQYTSCTEISPSFSIKLHFHLIQEQKQEEKCMNSQITF